MTIRYLEKKVGSDDGAFDAIEKLTQILDADCLVVITAKQCAGNIIKSGLHYHCSDELAEMMMEYGIKAIQQQNN
jgi:hypothetical protein